MKLMLTGHWSDMRSGLTIVLPSSKGKMYVHAQCGTAVSYTYAMARYDQSVD